MTVEDLPRKYDRILKLGNVTLGLEMRGVDQIAAVSAVAAVAGPGGGDWNAHTLLDLQCRADEIAPGATWAGASDAGSHEHHEHRSR